MKRECGSLGSSLEHSLNLYTLAATAAGVGLLALVQPAEAKVIYTPAHARISNSSFYLILNRQAVPDFVINNLYGTSHGVHFAGLEGHALGSKNFFETSRTNVGGGYFMDPAALKRGAQIPPAGGNQGFKTYGSVLQHWSDGIGGEGYFGNWFGAKDRFLGLKFQNNGETHYGWARLTVTNYSCAATLTGFAFETIPNKPIIAGRTKGPDVVTMPSATLGHLARGASAIPAWQREDQ